MSLLLIKVRSSHAVSVIDYKASEIKIELAVLACDTFNRFQRSLFISLIPESEQMNQSTHCIQDSKLC